MAVLTVQDDTPLFGDPVRALQVVPEGTSPGSLVRVYDGGGQLGVFTVGCKTVQVRGQSRTFTEQKRPFTDDFGRTPTSEWGASPGGGSWVSVNGSAANYTIAAGKGLINPSSTNLSRYIRLSDDDIATYNIRVDFTQDLVAAGASQSVGIITGYSGVDDHYRFRVTFNAGGTASATIAKNVGGTETVIASAATVHATYADTDEWHLRATGDASGNLTFTVWRNADAEPGTPTRSATDTTFTVGKIGLRVLRSTGSTSNVTVSFDNYQLVSGTWAHPPSVTHTTWIRALASPFTSWSDELAAWLRAAAVDTTPDGLAYAVSFITGGPAITDPARANKQVLGEAGYGPLNTDGTRIEGSDFNDYIGISWIYPASAGGATDNPEATQLHCTDCSGFVRMVYGYWLRLPMTQSDSAYFDGNNIPRASKDQSLSGPGLIIARAAGFAPSTTDMRIGDVVFFDATNGGEETAGQIDHEGIYLGVDSLGKMRFISARKTNNGPTFGDLNGTSIIGSGSGFYQTAFRLIRRF